MTKTWTLLKTFQTPTFQCFCSRERPAELSSIICLYNADKNNTVIQAKGTPVPNSFRIIFKKGASREYHILNTED